VSTQLGHFARGDLAAAYAVTTTTFQRLMDLAAFETLIRSRYPYLLTSPGHRLAECWAVDGAGYILAGVRDGSREVVLRYDVSEEPGFGWRIDGAVALPAITLPAEQSIASPSLGGMVGSRARRA
jgi:hypothetical protein